jgi:hypothetical protein
MGRLICASTLRTHLAKFRRRNPRRLSPRACSSTQPSTTVNARNSHTRTSYVVALVCAPVELQWRQADIEACARRSKLGSRNCTGTVLVNGMEELGQRVHTVTIPTGSTAQHSTAQHSTAQHSTAQHSTAQHSTAQHSTDGTAWHGMTPMHIE